MCAALLGHVQRMKFGLVPLIALCAACATAVPGDPTRPAPEPAMPRAAPAEPVAADSPGALQERLMSDPNFAGLYMHPRGSDTAIVLFTGADPARQLARYTNDARFRARSARYSYARLSEVQRALGAAFERERIYFMTSSTDVIGNRVEVDVVDEADTRAEARARGGGYTRRSRVHQPRRHHRRTADVGARGHSISRKRAIPPASS